MPGTGLGDATALWGTPNSMPVLGALPRARTMSSVWHPVELGNTPPKHASEAPPKSPKHPSEAPPSFFCRVGQPQPGVGLDCVLHAEIQPEDGDITVVRIHTLRMKTHDLTDDSERLARLA